MKMLSGALFLLAAEQAYAHANLVQFPNHDSAAEVLIPASVVFSVLGLILTAWGLVSDLRTARGVSADSR